jgi:hypothetical protein
VADGNLTFMMLILDHLEGQQARKLWDNKRGVYGCFYDQTYATRTSVIDTYFCPSQAHDTRIVAQVNASNDGHSHPANDPDPAAGGGRYKGSISDYTAVAGSTCSVEDDNGMPWEYTRGFDNQNSHTVDGPVPAVKNSNTNGPPRVIKVGNRVIGWKAETSFKSITDGLSTTLLVGEVSRAQSERSLAFNGDFAPFYWVGFRQPFCQRCGLPPNPDPLAPGGDPSYGDNGFGGNHPGVVNFVMCDASVKPISRDVDMNIMDRAASRNREDIYNFEDSGGTVCP